MSLYEKFKDEAEFRNKFVKPLLNRLGFAGVELQHGSQEFGKDFVFSELHRLGGMRNYAAQVKHEAKISQGPSVDGLLSQIRQAFAKPFKRADSPREQHVAAVYVFNSGEITANAREQMLSELGRERYGDNVHFLDGEKLDSLNQWSTYRSDNDSRRRLLALHTQLKLNVAVWESLLHVSPTESGFIDARGTLWHGIESYLSSPIFDDETIETSLVYNVWQRARTIDNVRQKLYFTNVAGDKRKIEVETLHRLIATTMNDAYALQFQIGQALNKLQPIT